jgi:anti-sigma factor RsiW
MNHPEDLLADYVDGSLGDASQASVDAHLAGCARCRSEVAAAGGVREALRALPEVDAPAGVAAEALRVAAAPAADERPPRYARVLPIAAAAVLVGLLAIAIPRIGGQSNDVRTAAEATDSSGGTTEGAAAPAARSSARDLARLAKQGPAVTDLQVDFDEAALEQLGKNAVAQWRGVPFPSTALDANGEAASFAADSLSASKCVFTQVPKDEASIIVQLLEATYQERPVYVAVVLEGTAAGRPADRAVVWIVYRDDCRLARFTIAKI